MTARWRWWRSRRRAARRSASPASPPIPTTVAAEFAIGLRSDWQGRGLGMLLMQRIIAVAQGRGIAELTGDVLHENKAMLQLCRSLGFAFDAHPDDPAVVRATKNLT